VTRLSVNVNKVAVLRNSRGGSMPDVTRAARLCLQAGAHGITVHPRPDRRHVVAEDLPPLAELVARFGVELNIEGNPFAPARTGYPGLLALCEQVRPAQVTLVPDSDGQLTSDHGFSFGGQDDASLQAQISAFRALGCRVSLFVDAGVAGLQRAAQMGADRIEIYTGPFAETHAHGPENPALELCARTASDARACGLGVNAGHDLSQANLHDFLARVEGVEEVSIGHALVGEALEDGLERTVQAYLAILERARR
jgi:pyridoxine 5-phosphate synthase